MIEEHGPFQHAAVGACGIVAVVADVAEAVAASEEVVLVHAASLARRRAVGAAALVSRIVRRQVGELVIPRGVVPGALGTGVRGNAVGRLDEVAIAPVGRARGYREGAGEEERPHRAAQLLRAVSACKFPEQRRPRAENAEIHPRFRRRKCGDCASPSAPSWWTA